MPNETDQQTDPRHVAGSAKGSETPIACACGVLLFFAAILIAVFSEVPALEEALKQAGGQIVLIVWLLCAFAFGGLAVWANKLETDGVSTASDMGVVQAIGWIVLAVGVISSFFFGI